MRASTVFLILMLILSLSDDCVIDDSLKKAVSVLGGRLTDLELLVQKMRAHTSAEGEI